MSNVSGWNVGMLVGHSEVPLLPSLISEPDLSHKWSSPEENILTLYDLESVQMLLKA